MGAERLAGFNPALSVGLDCTSLLSFELLQICVDRRRIGVKRLETLQRQLFEWIVIGTKISHD